MSRIQATVKGMVQGVGFRYFVMRQASILDRTGYVRNCRDGSVEVEAEGDKENLETLVKQLHRGPALSRVSNVQVEWLDDEKGYDSFDLKW